MAYDIYGEVEEKIERSLRIGSISFTFSCRHSWWMVSEEDLLDKFPESLCQLSKLKSLDLSGNVITTLPETLSQLTQLEAVDISYNQLIALPESLGNLKQLKELDLSHNQLTTLPDSLGNLKQLKELDLSDNQLTDLPNSLSKLDILDHLDLSGNPLNPELATAYRNGLASVKRYLLELAKGTKKRYEAKLMILGDGNEGKTCVSRALRDIDFEEQTTTHGVDVEYWVFAHPDHIDDEEKQITLNIWDFEGQEINHQTHQFFLNSQALYILVFSCRDQFLMDRAEYWLDTIRARARHAKVAIVITQCEHRTPDIPQDKLQKQYGDLLTEGKWLFTIGCANNSGVEELQDYLKRSAADLKFMGREWPASYDKAEEAIKLKIERGAAHINLRQLYDIFTNCEIDQNIYEDLAAAMSALGLITQFQDCPDLCDFIVLQPQWLTKAISLIMEDEQLADKKGVIALSRMKKIWEDKDYTGLFPAFHTCMKEFELCYDLEDGSRRCLVPLRFGYQEPPISWSPLAEAKVRRVEYKLNIRPPKGFMSRFIVKAHNMIVPTMENPNDLYWHNGVFLTTGKGDLMSEALCDFNSDERKLSIEVRAAFPQSMMEQLHAYVKSVFSFYEGLESERRYGCIKLDQQSEEIQCTALYSENRIYSSIQNKQLLYCEYEFHKDRSDFHRVDPGQLISGYSSFGENVLESNEISMWLKSITEKIEALTLLSQEHDKEQKKIIPALRQEMQLNLHRYFQMFDNREATSVPCLVSITTKDKSKWNPAGYSKSKYVLTPFCECEGNIHSCIDGQVEFTKDKEWWAKSAPWVARATKLLSIGLQLSFVGMPVALGSKIFDGVQDDVKFMNELTKHLELEVGGKDISPDEDFLAGSTEKDLRGNDKDSRLMRTALARFLKEAAPDNYEDRLWGSLQRYRMPDDSYRWLCDEHQPRG